MVTSFFSSVHCDDVGRLIVANFELNNVNCSVCNVYCPNNVTERIKFLADTKDFVLTHAMTKQNLYIGGDFNCAQSPIDKVSDAWTKAQMF